MGTLHGTINNLQLCSFSIVSGTKFADFEDFGAISRPLVYCDRLVGIEFDHGTPNKFFTILGA